MCDINRRCLSERTVDMFDINRCDFVSVFVVSNNVCRFCLYKLGPEVIKLFSCSTQLSMKFFLLINVKIF